MFNPQRVELSVSRTNFLALEDVQANKVRLYPERDSFYAKINNFNIDFPQLHDSEEAQWLVVQDNIEILTLI